VVHEAGEFDSWLLQNRPATVASAADASPTG
jgi:hypothetical protein